MSPSAKKNCKIHNVEQGSPEWHALRNKYPLTASEAQAIGNKGKGLESLVWAKLAERYSNSEREEYTNDHINRGNELEEHAKEMYELETEHTVAKVGFVTNEEVSPVGGASPDGMIDDDGLVEIKCFADVKHFKSIVEYRSGSFTVEPQYMWQMQMQMLFTERSWVDFIAYNPNYVQSLLIQRVEPDRVMQEKIRTGLKVGEKLLLEIENKLYGK